MKTKSEIYQIALEELKSLSCSYGTDLGICFAIDMSFNKNAITKEELVLIKQDFNRRKPSLFSKFFWNQSYKRGSMLGGYWWYRDEDGAQQRIKFLEHLIKKTKNENS